jgi:hypothetical protein
MKKQTASRSAKLYRELGRKIQVHHNTVKKYLTKMRVHRKAKKIAPKTTAHQQSVIKAWLKLLTQNLFTDDESYFTVDGNEWQSYYESEDHPATEDFKFIRKTKIPAKVLLWLADSKSGISEPFFVKAGLAVNKEVFISKCLPVLHKFIQKHHKNEKNVFWPDLVSAHYKLQDTLVRLEI